MKFDLFCLFVWIKECKQTSKQSYSMCKKCKCVCYFQSINILSGINWNNDSNEKETDEKIIEKLSVFVRSAEQRQKFDEVLNEVMHSPIVSQ